MQKKSLKLNFFFNMLLNVSKVAFPLITAPYVARVLEPDGVGLYNFSNTYASYFALFALLGIPMYGIREVAKLRDDKNKLNDFVSEVFSATVITTFFCSILFVLSVVCVSQLNRNILIFLIAGVVLYTSPFRIDWFFSGKEEFGFITLRSLLIKTISVFCLFAFVREKDDLFIYTIIFVCSFVVNEIWNFIRLRNTGIRLYFTLRGIRHIKSSMTLFSAVVAASIYTYLDSIMLGFLTDYSQVGFYNSATHISKSLLPIVTSLAVVALPRLSYYLKDEKWDEINALVEKSVSVTAFLCFPITFAVIAIAPEFIPLFYGPLFSSAILPLQIIIGVVIAIGFSNLLGVQILAGLGHDKLLLIMTLVGAIVNFSLNVVLIPSYGAIGAAIASVLAEFIVMFVGLIFVVKKTPVVLNGFGEVLGCFFVASLLFVVKIVLSEFVSGWLLVISFCICGSLLYIAIQFFMKNSSEMMIVSLMAKKIKERKNI